MVRGLCVVSCGVPVPVDYLPNVVACAAMSNVFSRVYFGVALPYLVLSALASSNLHYADLGLSFEIFLSC